MGAPDDDPERGRHEEAHRVRLTRGFWMMDHEVTQDEWAAVSGKRPVRQYPKFRGTDLEGGARPVVLVSWSAR
jgi:formylglycine-generating enzyme required for sulfatase activity